MKKIIVSLMKKAGEKTAQIPIGVRSWPTVANQPKMPEALRIQMEERDNI